MFEQSFVSNRKTRRSWTVLVAFGGQVVVIGLLLAIPMFFIDSLPITQFSSVLLAPPPPPPPPPPPAPPAQARVARATQTTPRKFDMRRLIAPKTIPSALARATLSGFIRPKPCSNVMRRPASRRREVGEGG